MPCCSPAFRFARSAGNPRTEARLRQSGVMAPTSALPLAWGADLVSRPCLGRPGLAGLRFRDDGDLDRLLGGA